MEQMALVVYNPGDHQFSCVKTHCATLKAGVLFAQSIGKLDSLSKGGADEDRVRKDKKRTMISQVLSNGSNFQKAIENLRDVVAHAPSPLDVEALRLSFKNSP